MCACRLTIVQAEAHTVTASFKALKHRRKKFGHDVCHTVPDAFHQDTVRQT
jgi:hypothetical protein